MERSLSRPIPAGRRSRHRADRAGHGADGSNRIQRSIAALFLGLILTLTTMMTTVGPGEASAGAPTTERSERIIGTVGFANGQPAPDVTIDLFASQPGGITPNGYLRSAITAGDGHFELTTVPGCYVLVATAPAGATFYAGNRRWQQPVCVFGGAPSRSLEITLQTGSPDRARLSGKVVHRAGRGAVGLAVELYQANGDGGRGRYLRSAPTDLDGLYRLDTEPGCYVVVVTAPPGDHFATDPGATAGPEATQAVPACAVDNETRALPPLVLASAREQAPAPSPVEREIVRLTNALRADPSGPLARRKPLPDCAADEFYDLMIDPITGQPSPVPPLRLDPDVSNVLARPWAAELQRSGQFEHRPAGESLDLYDRLDRHVSVWGENIAWFAGYDPARTAWIHFEGWRESDSGHFCALLTSRFTRLGVGEVRAGEESWAVQNFYS